MGRALNGIKKMAHTVDDKTNLLAQTKQLRQKVEKLESLLTKEVSCEDVMEVVAEAREVVQSLADEVGEDHDAAHKSAA